MKYSDLIQFQPIERIIQLRDANKSERAKTFVNTYVISDVMADRLAKLILPQMRIDQPGDAKGMLVVGNYGTGKSHLMSVLSAVAEHENFLDDLSNAKVREAAGPIAGKFKVIRMEIGAVKMGLRDIITKNIDKQLRDWDVDFTFPADDQVTENKTSFEDLMHAFDQVFPGRGLFVVVDELLDYLRSRNQQELTLDLGFLREIGEVCKDLKFRFMAGVQEAIFESDRFAFVAESLARVSDRFDEVKIQKTDINFVVANRLLKKTDHQKAQIKAYLEPFARFYEGWTERLSEFIELFPVHPDYIRTFERLPIVEQRGVLQVLSLKFRELENNDLPQDYPGVLALDSFWSYIKDKSVLLSDEDLRLTMECSDLLTTKVTTGFPKNRRQYSKMAIRIVEGLSVHRLTTPNLNAPIGMTPEEIRDQLCLYHPFVAEMGGSDPSEDLLTLVDVTLKEIKTCVSGQFISQNDDNRQWYLDLKKTEDFDALIDKRVGSLNDEDLDLAYFNVLAQVMEASEPSEFTGFRIWESAMPWKEKNVTKLGWLFFGVPSERSTAQPPRDFYVYFPQIINPPKFKDEKRADEIFFRVDASDENFRTALARYAAALALKASASGSKKQEYAKKAEANFGILARWLRENFLSKVKLTYQGSCKSLSQALAGEHATGKTTREQVFLAASAQLNKHFEAICGSYPKFSRQLTFGRNGNIEHAVQDALRSLQGSPSQAGAAVIDGLGLYDGERINPQKSSYAQFILECMREKGHGQVLNRSELVRTVDGIDYFLAPGKFRLEVELLVVVMGALVYSGEVILSIPGKDFSATELPELASRPVRDLCEFKHLKQPKDWNIAAIKSLFELLGLPPGLAIKITQNDNEAVVQLGAKVNQLVEKLVLSRQEFGNGIPFWGTRLLKEDEIASISSQMDATKQFLESLQAFNTPAKLKNFKYSAEEVASHRPAFEQLAEIDALKTFADALSEYTIYLSNAQSVLAEDNPWVNKCKTLKQSLIAKAQEPENRRSETLRKKVIQQLRELKQEYIQIYLKAYQHSRLDLSQDKRKEKLLRDPRMRQLNALATISTMNVSQLTDIQKEFGSLKTGENLTVDDLEDSPLAGEFYPAMESPGGISAEQRLNNLEQKLEDTHQAWTSALLNEFEDPAIQENLQLIDTSARTRVEAFIASKELPDEVDRDFVHAIQQALSGLSRIELSPQSIENALFPGGAACTVEDFKDRFADYLDTLVKGQDRAKVRLVLKRD
jgi:hypothetical protein